MPRFTTRVQLFGDPEWGDYARLNAAMKEKGFTQTINNGSSIQYHLPNGEYDREANLTRDQVLKDAKQAAAPVWDHFCILVTESTGRAWHNLKATK